MNTQTTKPMDDCIRFSCSMSPYVDGELDPAHAVDMEAHVLSCKACAERVTLLRAMRLSMRRTVEHRAPDALRIRMAALITEERKRVDETQADESTMSPKLIRLRYAFGLAAAAAVVLAVGMSRKAHPLSDEQESAAADVASAMGVDTMLDDLVALHANPLPPETTNPEELRRWDPLVGVPVRRPTFQPFGASFSGARVHAMADRRAALLQYTLHGGHRVTVYVFNPRVVSMRTARSLEPRVIRERPVYVGHLRGYSIAAAEQSGVGYALATDLDADESTRMVLAALQQ